MNVLELKNGDMVTLTTLYDDEGGGNLLTKLQMDEGDTNIYAEFPYGRNNSSKFETLFFQYKGNKQYQYISCRIDRIYRGFTPSLNYIISDFKIKSKNYALATGWGSSSGIYLVESFKNNIPFINWQDNPLEGDK